MIKAPNDSLFTNSLHPVSQTTIAITGDNLSTFVSHDPGFFFPKCLVCFVYIIWLYSCSLRGYSAATVTS